MSPPGAERGPATAPVQTHQLRLEDTTDTPTPAAIPRCVGCGAVTLRPGADGRPWHQHCEPQHDGLTDPLTSRRGAAKARKGPGSPLARLILEELRRRGDRGATDSELQEMFADHSPGSCAKRRLDLVRRGLVVDTGRTRPSRFGMPSIVWRAS